MKRIGLICLTVITCGSLAACGDQQSTSKQSNNSSTAAKVTDTTHKFGQSAILTKGNQKAKMTVQSVKAVSPDDDLVVDVSHNYKATHQYVIVTYKVTALSNKIDLDAFDGSNLALYDSKGQSSIGSSNRDTVAPKELHKGETQVMEIGEGMRNKSSKVTIHYGNETWKGKISQDDPSSSSSLSGESSDNQSTQATSTQKSKAISNSDSVASQKNTSMGNNSDEDYWNSLSPQEQEEWRKWESAESYANSPEYLRTHGQVDTSATDNQSSSSPTPQ